MDLAEQLSILQAAQGNPALLALATVDLAHNTLPAEERTRIKDALVAAAVPHWCDRDFLAVLLVITPEEGDRLLGQLCALTVIEPFPARGEHTVNVHETARLALREHLCTTDVARWKALSTRARAHVGQGSEPHARIEALYHLFAIDQPAAASSCEALDREFTDGGRPEVRHALALALGELTAAGWLTGSAQVEALLAPLEVRNDRGEAAQLEAEARNVAHLAHTASHPSGVGRAHCLLGDVLRTKGRLDDALVAYREFFAIFERLAAADPSNAGWQREPPSRIPESVKSPKQRVASTTRWPRAAKILPSSSVSPRPTRPTPAGSTSSPSHITDWARLSSISETRKMRSRAAAPLLRPWSGQSPCRPEPLCGSRSSVISRPGSDWEGARSMRDRLRRILAFDLNRTTRHWYTDYETRSC